MAKKPTKSKSTNVYLDHVAGLQYSDYQRVNIKAGDAVELRRETSNPADTNAIAVYIHGTRCGFIKRPQNQRLIGLKRDGAKFEASVVSFNKNNPSWQALVISVDVTMPEANEKDGEKL